MTPQEFRRRAMMNFGASGDKWDGFGFGETLHLGQSDAVIEAKICLTPLISCVVGHQITFNPAFRFGNQGLRYMQHAFVLGWYNSDKIPIGYNALTDMPRTVSAQQPFMRMPFDFDNIANAYIKDETTGEYLWRGSDYVE